MVDGIKIWTIDMLSNALKDIIQGATNQRKCLLLYSSGPRYQQHVDRTCGPTRHGCLERSVQPFPESYSAIKASTGQIYYLNNSGMPKMGSTRRAG